MKKLKNGQLFKLYGLTWQVRKQTMLSPCLVCEVFSYWWNSNADPIKDPCKYMCGCHSVIPPNCFAKLVSEDENARRCISKQMC